MPLQEIVGHRALMGLVSRAIARGTLPPALLLAGPAGVGKRRVALAMAQAVNCLQPRSDGAYERDACGDCVACRRIQRGVHPDVVLLEPDDKGAIRIEPVRDVIGRAGYRPFEGRRRVIVIDEADALTEDAQSALLKTLEEPPEASVFLLVSSTPDSLLSTVRSRCPRLRFAALQPAEVAEVLMRDHDYSEPDARAAAADADGSVGYALSAASADLAAAREQAQQLLVHAARTTDPARRLEAAKGLFAPKGTPAGDRDQLRACVRVLATLLRDLVALAAGADPGTLANADCHSWLKRLTEAFGHDRALAAYAATDRALGALERNANSKVVADWLVLQI